MDLDIPNDYFLRAPNDEEFPVLERDVSHYNPLHKYTLPVPLSDSYEQQYGDLYFLRLARLRPFLHAQAEEDWADFQVAGETVKHVGRVLQVRQGELCWIIGTIYMDMPLKPDVLRDITRKHWVAAPPPREKWLSPDGTDQIMLEDDSGRLQLVGLPVQNTPLTTGVVIAAMGTENKDGQFEVIDIKVPDLPPQPERWARDTEEKTKSNGTSKRKSTAPPEGSKGNKVAFLSGLGISGDEGDDLAMGLLTEYLLGESGGPDEQKQSASITRLIIAGNSIASAAWLEAKELAKGIKKVKKYRYDSSDYNQAPTIRLDLFMADLLPTLPITILPGADDPANVAMPQIPLHYALVPMCKGFAENPKSGKIGWFDSVTNPWEGDVDGWRFLGTGGQPIDDAFKYLETEDRLDVMENLLRWRCVAPTAPDTLHTYPMNQDDPFVMDECPHVYFVGNQPEFQTTTIEGPSGQQVRIIAIPKFRETGQIVLLDLDTLEAEVVEFGAHEPDAETIKIESKVDTTQDVVID